MKFSYTLLKKLVPSIKSPKQLMEALTFHAFEVERVDGDTIDISIPANRYSDAASHRGIAQIVSAIFSGKLLEPKVADLKSQKNSQKFNVDTVSSKLCQRYSGLYAEIPKIADSPKWMQEILISCGLRPINNVVDVMNYVMLEVGQPMHVFDYDELGESRKRKARSIIIRTSKNGEEIETIDGGKYDLGVNDLIIADQKGSLAIAGIKGGKRAEVTSKTKRIIVEAANFDSISVYKTSRRLNLFTDASARFSHGLSSALVEKGIKRAAQLLKEVCGAKLGDWVDVNYVKPSKAIIKFDAERFNKLTGLNLSEKTCFEYLKKLGFQVRGKFVEPPLERTDVAIFEDLAEEIVNLYGYDQLPSAVPHALLIPSGAEDQIVLKDKIRSILIGFGLSEVYNYSFIGKADAKDAKKDAPPTEWASLASVGGNDAKTTIELENPISEDKKYLRPGLVAGLLKNTEDNLRFFEAVRVFEIGRAFWKEKNAVKEKPILGIAAGGKISGAFLELKGIIDQLLRGVGLTSFDFLPYEWGVRVESDHRVLGYVKFVDERAVAEIDLDELLQVAVEEREYWPLPKFPSVVRDLSFVVDSEIRIAPIQNVIENASHLLDDVDLLDWYEDPKLGPNRKSLTFRLVFQAEDRTLTDEEIGKEMGKTINALRTKFEIEIR